MRVPVRERATHSRRPGGVTRQQAVAPAHNSSQVPAVAALAEGVQPSPSAGLCSPATRRSEEAERGWAIPFVYTNHPPGGHAGGPAATKKHRARKLSTTSLTDAPRTQPACSADSPYRPCPGLLPGGRRRPLCPCSLLAPWARDFSHCVLRKGARRVYSNHGNRA